MPLWVFTSLKYTEARFLIFFNWHRQWRIHRYTFKLIRKASEKSLKLSFAESCTGGMLAAAITDMPGASHIFDGSKVTYANHIKTQELGVPKKLLDEHGAVSEEVAAAMAEGLSERMGADISLSITGIAGPGGGSVGKPVGTVFIGIASKGKGTQVNKFRFKGNRKTIRLKTVLRALKLLNAYIG